MATINFGNAQDEVQDTILDSEHVEESSDTIDETSHQMSVDDSGMSSIELNDPNKIKATIVDNKTPIVVLFGPPACGKTMTLVRLTRYLKSQGYTVEPIPSFRPSYDRNYQEMCKNFDYMISQDDAAGRNERINFMLVRVLKNGKPLCQILEGPGEYYFNPKAPKAQFPAYVSNIISSPNRKIWTIMLEPDNTNGMDNQTRKLYANKLERLKTKIDYRSKIVFLFNKIDETHCVISPGNIRYGQLLQQTEQLYQNIFVPFMNVNPISKLWRKYNFDFLAFQTGDYVEASDGTQRFEEGADIYPKKLWKLLQKRIRG